MHERWKCVALIRDIRWQQWIWLWLRLLCFPRVFRPSHLQVKLWILIFVLVAVFIFAFYFLPFDVYVNMWFGPLWRLDWTISLQWTMTTSNVRHFWRDSNHKLSIIVDEFSLILCARLSLEFASTFFYILSVVWLSKKWNSVGLLQVDHSKLIAYYTWHYTRRDTMLHEGESCSMFDYNWMMRTQEATSHGHRVTAFYRITNTKLYAFSFFFNFFLSAQMKRNLLKSKLYVRCSSTIKNVESSIEKQIHAISIYSTIICMIFNSITLKHSRGSTQLRRWRRRRRDNLSFGTYRTTHSRSTKKERTT